MRSAIDTTASFILLPLLLALFGIGFALAVAFAAFHDGYVAAFEWMRGL